MHNHVWIINERHPQIIAERKVGTKRVNFCIKCGEKKK